MKKILTIITIALTGFTLSFCSDASNVKKETPITIPTLTVAVDTPMTLAKKLIDDVYEHPNDWVELEDSSKIMLPDRQTEEWAIYNKKCNFKLEFSVSYFSLISYKRIILTQPDTLTFSFDEQEQLFQAYGESIFELKQKKEARIKDSIQAIEDAKRKIKEQNLLKTFCK